MRTRAPPRGPRLYTSLKIIERVLHSHSHGCTAPRRHGLSSESGSRCSRCPAVTVVYHGPGKPCMPCFSVAEERCTGSFPSPVLCLGVHCWSTSDSSPPVTSEVNDILIQPSCAFLCSSKWHFSKVTWLWPSSFQLVLVWQRCLVACFYFCPGASVKSMSESSKVVKGPRVPLKSNVHVFPPQALQNHLGSVHVHRFWGYHIRFLGRNLPESFGWCCPWTQQAH